MKIYEILKALTINACRIVVDEALARRFQNILDVIDDKRGGGYSYYVKEPMQLKAGAIIATDYEFPRGQLAFVREIKSDSAPENESDESDFLTEIIDEKEPELQPEPEIVNSIETIEDDDFSHLPESDVDIDEDETAPTDAQEDDAAPQNQNTNTKKHDKKRR